MTWYYGTWIPDEWNQNKKGTESQPQITLEEATDLVTQLLSNSKPHPISTG